LSKAETVGFLTAEANAKLADPLRSILQESQDSVLGEAWIGIARGPFEAM